MENLSGEEKQNFDSWLKNAKELEMLQLTDLIENCNIPFQYAKTHSIYIQDWERLRFAMEENLRNNILPPGVSTDFFRAMIGGYDQIIQRKLRKSKAAFFEKFGEPIDNYLGKDGKTREIPAFVLIPIIIIIILTVLFSII